MLIQTAKTAVLLNGILGPWIQMKRGLRQGDPISPLLFIIIADILQQTIRITLRHCEFQVVNATAEWE